MHAVPAVPAVQVPDAYEEPGERVFTPGENLLDWLTDKRGRDQFVLRCARCAMLRCGVVCSAVLRRMLAMC